MNIEEIKTQVLGLPEVSAWPEMVAVFEDQVTRPNQIWEWPYRACRAVGADESLATPSSAALLCLCCSLLLVDDMLDEDPRGVHLRLGGGAAANISNAFQFAAFRMITGMPIDADRKGKLAARFAEMGLATVYGQELDSRNLPGEEDYWRVLRAKNFTYFGTGMYAGAVLGCASAEVEERLFQLGGLTGEAIQLHDDLKDAFETPANPDWKQNRNNLLFLYAQTADHPDRERFQTLRSETDDPEKLKAAQEILLRSGAASYGMYQLCQRYRAGLKILAETPLVDPKPLREVVTKYIRPLVSLLENVGIAVPPEIRVE
jgi:geranylgeranyl pyrophosphate synthase